VEPHRWAVLCLVDSAHALDPSRTRLQYVREPWSAEATFPGGPVRTITQTADGYLWIASQKGLVRFDGFNFRLLSSSNPMLQDDRIRGLTTDNDGKLLVFFWSASVRRQYALANSLRKNVLASKRMKERLDHRGCGSYSAPANRWQDPLR
jgi:ligand-binding sensor domain-containing protein